MNARSYVNSPFKDFSVAKPPPDSFAARLSYLRWLRIRETGVFENAREFSEFAGVTYALYVKWQDSLVAPPQRATAMSFLSAGLSKVFGATDKWLLDGHGEPPQPALWAVWTAPVPKRGTKVADLDVPKRRHG